MSLFDPTKSVTETAKEKIAAKLSDLQNHVLIRKRKISDYFNQIYLAPSISKAVEDCIYVQESGPENLDVKKELTLNIDKATPDHIPIASSTSGIPTSLYANELKGNYRCIVAHPINPPHLIPAVEIVPAPFTNQSTIKTVKTIISSIGKEPIELNKEIPGFIVNRLQGALLIEAFNLAKEGICSAQEIDKAISAGLGLRWSLMGPFETIHLNASEGIAGYVERYEKMYQEIFNRTDLDWSSVINHGLEKELLSLYDPNNREEHESERDSKLTQLILHKNKH